MLHVTSWTMLCLYNTSATFKLPYFCLSQSLDWANERKSEFQQLKVIPNLLQQVKYQLLFYILITFKNVFSKHSFRGAVHCQLFFMTRIVRFHVIDHVVASILFYWTQVVFRFALYVIQRLQSTQIAQPIMTDSFSITAKQIFFQ